MEVLSESEEEVMNPLKPCAKNNCPTCDGELESLPGFLNEYAVSHQDCLVCKENLPADREIPSFDTVKVLKEICIRSILPEVTVQDGVLHPSYPFCEGCTLDKINNLTHLYRQLLVLQESYDEARFDIVAPIITSYAQERKKTRHSTHKSRSGSQLFRYWKRALSYPGREEENVEFTPGSEEDREVEANDVGTGGESVGPGPANCDSYIPRQIPSGDELLSEDEFRIKSEPLDDDSEGDDALENCSFISQQKELLEDLTSNSEEVNSYLPNFNYFGSSSDSDEPSKSSHNKSSHQKFLKKRKNISNTNLLGAPGIYTTQTQPRQEGRGLSLTRRILPKKRKLLLKNGSISRQGQPVVRTSQTNSSKRRRTTKGESGDISKRKNKLEVVPSPSSSFSSIAIKPEPGSFLFGEGDSPNGLNFSDLPLTFEGNGRRRGRQPKTVVRTPKSSGVRKSLRTPPDKKTLPKTDLPKRVRGRPKNKSLIPASKPKRKRVTSPRITGKYQEQDFVGNNSWSDDHHLELFKCTPSIIIEGDHLDVKALPFLRGEEEDIKIPTRDGKICALKTGRQRPPSPPQSTFTDDYYDGGPSTPNYFHADTEQEMEQQEDPTGDRKQEAEENKRIKQGIATESLPKKRKSSVLPKNSDATKKTSKERKPSAPRRGQDEKKKSSRKTLKKQSGTKMLADDIPPLPLIMKLKIERTTLPDSFSIVDGDGDLPLTRDVDVSPSPRSRSIRALPQYLEDDQESDHDPNADVDDGESSASSGSNRPSRSRVKKRLQKPPSSNKTRGPDKSPRGRRPVFGPKPKKKYTRLKTSRMCSLCGKILVSDWNLTVHMRIHNDQKNIVCKVEGCGKRFFKTDNLDTHMRSHTNERPYKCEICSNRFSYRVVLRTHKAAKHGIYDCEGVFECSCGEKTISESFLKKHLKRCDSRRRKKGVGILEDPLLDRYKVWCNYCEVQFEDGDSFKDHTTGDEKHIQIRNEKVAEARKDLADYRTKEKEGIEVDESLKCRVCGEIQLDSRLLQLHINKFHTWNTPKALNCEVCGKGFSTPGILKTHMIIHSEDKPFVCDVCGHKSNTKVQLEVHKEREHSGPPLPCPHCGKEIRKERALLRHLATNHKEIHLRHKPHVCPSCYKIWATLQELQDHLAAEHKDVTCLTCGKVFGYRYDLNKHMKREHPADPMPPRKEGAGDDDECGSGDEDSSQGVPPPLMVKSKVRGRPRKGQSQFKEYSNPIFTNLNPPSSAGATTSFHQGHGEGMIPRSLPLPLVSANFDEEYDTVMRMSQQSLDAQIQNPHHNFPHNYMYN